jgi:hypothetical protein
MDSPAQAGPSVPRKPRHKAVKAAAKAEAASAGGMDIDVQGGPSTSSGASQPQAGSSKLATNGVDGKRVKERHHRRKAEAANGAEQGADVNKRLAQVQKQNGAPGSGPGPGTGPGHAEGEGKKNRSRKRKGQHGGQGQVGQESAAVWECHPLAQGNVSSIPPVWSPDGRCVSSSIEYDISCSGTERVLGELGGWIGGEGAGVRILRPC